MASEKPKRTPGRPRKSGDAPLPDDRKDRRSVTVPDDLWEYVTRTAKKADKSEAAIVRFCIAFSMTTEKYTYWSFQNLKLYFETCINIEQHFARYVVRLTTITKELKLEKDFSKELAHASDSLMALHKLLDQTLSNLPPDIKDLPPRWFERDDLADEWFGKDRNKTPDTT